MTNEIIIEVENLSKIYQLGQFNTGALSHDLKRWWALRRGKEDPFLKIGDINNTVGNDTSNFVWSLKDINFQIKQGEAVGLIGHNGAGKSTILKILSQITSPSKGEVRMNGRIASLLEVGTGFHPELTGRENIFLNGAILGMRKHEIKTKFDEIVDFAGIEKYIDTPVKRYSSGMYVRLAFAVAAHLESEILIVDEVLAVGDADFQKRCLGKMGDISKGEGRTVLFVSHNMSAISALCNRCLVFNKGKLDFDGDTTTAISHYLSSNIDSIYQTKNINDIILPIIKKAWFENLTGKVTSNFYNGDPIVILIESANPLNMPLEISLAFFDNMKRPLWNFTHAMHGLSSIPKDNKLLNKFTFFPPPLTVNEVSIDIGIGPKGGTPYFDHVISGLKYTILNKEEGTMYVKHPEWPIFCEVKLESEKLI